MHEIRAVTRLAIGLFWVLMSSCTKTHNPFYHDSRVMVRTVTADQEATKASSSATHRHTYSLQDGLMLEEMVSDYGFEENGLTKGAVITANGSNKINASGRRFNIEGWLGPDIATDGYDSSEEDKQNQHFMSDSPAYDGSSWNLSSEHFWRNGVSTTFWSYFVPEGGPAPVFSWPGATPTDAQLNTLNFTYTLPASSGNNNDAYNSQDILIAYNQEKRTIKDDGSVEMTSGTGISSKENSIGIHFYHPLSAIKFMVGDISGDDEPTENEYVNITKVELVGVKTTGSFTASGTAPNGCTVTCNSTSGSATYSQAATRAEIEDGKFTDASSEFIFFMIPQNVDNVTVKLTMVRKKKTIIYESDGTTIHSIDYGEDIEFTREVSLSGAWAPGKFYTYRIDSTVYFGGEEKKLPNNLESSDNISVDSGGKITFSFSGQGSLDEWVAPLPTKGVNILKLTFTHTYSNSSGKSTRRIWLENATTNPDWTGPDDTDHPHFINPLGIKTYNSDLVAEAIALTNASNYWKDSHYTGYLGEFTYNGSKYIPTGYDNNMNNAGGTYTSTMYFYLGGKFDNVKVHFEYSGNTGGGSSNWSAQSPIFNVINVIE